MIPAGLSYAVIEQEKQPQISQINTDYFNSANPCKSLSKSNNVDTD